MDTERSSQFQSRAWIVANVAAYGYFAILSVLVPVASVWIVGLIVGVAHWLALRNAVNIKLLPWIGATYSGMGSGLAAGLGVGLVIVLAGLLLPPTDGWVAGGWAGEAILYGTSAAAGGTVLALTQLSMLLGGGPVLGAKQFRMLLRGGALARGAPGRRWVTSHAVMFGLALPVVDTLGALSIAPSLVAGCVFGAILGGATGGALATIIERRRSAPTPRS
jgi:hypothetical protein